MHGDVREEINENLIMQALLTIARDLIEPPRDPEESLGDDP